MEDASARTSLAQLSAIVESCEEAIVGTALDGTITVWNRGAERAYNHRASDAIGKRFDEVDHDSEELSRALGLVLLREATGFARTSVVERVQLTRAGADGVLRDLVVAISPIVGASGAVEGASLIGHDVTPNVAAQREVDRLAARREHFLAMLSHELRNPLAAVLNATRVMSDAEFAGPTVEQCHAVLYRQATHMARLLDDLLDVSRVTSGKFELRRGDVDLRGPIEAAVESTAPMREARGIRLVVDLPPDPVPVRGDASRLQQVVVNLLSNAATYSPPGSEVRLHVARDGERAVITVTDAGAGIAPEMIGKIFDLFVQATQRIDRERGGLGVGLSLAKTVIDLHGGTIEAQSDGEGQGSTFVVKLPLQARALFDAPRAAQPSRSCRIVLVEDQADAREMLKLLLERRHHTVVEAGDGASGIEAIEREHPDCALVDIGLPVVNGYGVARQVRARPELDDVYLIALTGYGAPPDVALSRESGFDEHLVKPIDIRKIEALLAKRFG